MLLLARKKHPRSACRSTASRWRSRGVFRHGIRTERYWWAWPRLLSVCAARLDTYACTPIRGPSRARPPRLTRPAGLCHTVPMSADLESRLQSYGELAVKVGLNLRAGQRLLIIGPLANGGASLEAAPLVRHIVDQRVRGGRAPGRDVIWGDEALLLRALPARAARLVRRVLGLAAEGAVRTRGGRARHAVDLRERSRSAERRSRPSSSARCSRPSHAACGRSASTSRATRPTGPSSRPPARGVGGARIPEAAAERAGAAAVGRDRRAVPPRSPGSDRRLGSASRRARARARDYLNAKHYTALQYAGPGTDADDRAAAGPSLGRRPLGQRDRASRFAPNLPTEEVFTMPHKDRVDGIVRSTKPLSYGGTLIEDFSLTLRRRTRRRRVTAERGEAVLRQLVDDGCRRGAARRAGAGAAQLAGRAVRAAVLQHAVRRERGEPRRARLRLQVHAARRRDDERRGRSSAPAATAARRTSTS